MALAGTPLFCFGSSSLLSGFSRGRHNCEFELFLATFGLYCPEQAATQDSGRENALAEKLPQLTVVSAEPYYLSHSASAKVSLDMNDEIDRFADLSLNIFAPGLLMTSHDQIRKTTQGFGRRIGVDCGQ